MCRVREIINAAWDLKILIRSKTFLGMGKVKAKTKEKKERDSWEKTKHVVVLLTIYRG